MRRGVDPSPKKGVSYHVSMSVSSFDRASNKAPSSAIKRLSSAKLPSMAAQWIGATSILIDGKGGKSGRERAEGKGLGPLGPV